jgi:anthranilate/para-aminobenzoate synthase component II
MRLTLIDNYDSFSFNLAHFLEELGSRAGCSTAG